MLPGDDATLLAAPISDFEVELRRIAVPPVPFQAVISTNGLTQETVDAELADLQSALGNASGSAAGLGAQLLRVRRQLQDFARQLDYWKTQVSPGESDAAAPGRPHLAAVEIPSGLPGEFEDYLRGSVAYYAGDMAAAQRAWEDLLQRPKAERKYRSTWAAFMLGRSYLESDPAKAEPYFQKVRALARSSFMDTPGLAASSHGWEALAELKQGHTAAALRLYLNQLLTGDRTAAPSLRLTVRKLIEKPIELPAIAADPIAQQVVTAYLISRRTLLDLNAPSEGADLVRAWLEAIEAADVAVAQSADRLALAAYQRGLFELAEKWLAHAEPRSAMAQWLRAKFLLRAGKVPAAAQILAHVVRAFPREGDWTGPTRGGAEPGGGEDWEDSPLRQSTGEYGVLLLARRQYYEALDTLLRAGYWSDAAYVAEYVLTPDELAAYVNRQWAEPDPDQTLPGQGSTDDSTYSIYHGFVRPQELREEIRYLTARRLARLQRWNEAAEFYPAQWRARLQAFAEALARGRDPSVAAADRAAALWDAAQIARHEGMELFGTEVEPDWHLFAGQFDWQHVSKVRKVSAQLHGSFNWPTNGGTWVPDKVQMTLAPGSADEQRRIDAHQPKPNQRFHYRYDAAELGWEASQLLPNNGEDTAYILWTAGSWLKARDPQYADRFYKALVRRCRRTPLGAEADRIRWFPKQIPGEVEAAPGPPPADDAPAPDVEQPVPEPDPASPQTEPAPPDHGP